MMIGEEADRVAGGGAVDGAQRRRAAERPPGGRRNNFDAVRLLAATSVVFSHAFLLAEDSEANEPLILLTGNQSILGLCGVFVFFAMSGFLVTQSWFAHRDPLGFLWRRALRILPALWVNLLLVGLVLGAVATHLPAAEYFASPKLGAFFVNNLLLRLTDSPLPGVWFSEHSTALVINGSLWTLRYEVMMYGMVLILGWAGLLRLSTSLLLLAIGVAALYNETSLHGDLGEFAWLLGFFASGMVMHFLRGTRWIDGRVAVAAALGLVAITYAHQLIRLFPIFGGYLAIFLATSWWPPVRRLRALGDLSYGIYIYGWPVEQAVLWASGGKIAWWQLFLASMTITFALAYASWHLVEKHALRLKDAIGRHPAGRASPRVPAALRAALRQTGARIVTLVGRS